MGDKNTTANLALQLLHVTSRFFFQMVNYYMLLPKIHPSASHVIILNKRILFILSVLWVFVMISPSTSFMMKHYMMDQNAPIIHFSVYTYQGICAKHGIIPNGPTLCKLCEEKYDINNGIIKRSIYGKKKNL